MKKGRRVEVAHAQTGERLARDVLSDDGRVLLAKGVTLTPTLLQLLEAHGIDSVYVLERGPSAEATPVPQVVRQQLTRELREAMREVAASFQQAASGLRLPTVPFKAVGLRRAVEEVVGEVVANPAAVSTLKGLREVDEYTMVHSVEVCILTTMLGNALGMGGSALVDLALCSLLHDIGKAGIPLEILNKPDRLTAEETEVMNRHTTLGWLALRDHPDLPPAAAQVALQHHERWGGGGYPLGLSGDRIHPYAKVCSVADVYDALTADRVYRAGMTPAAAMRLMSGPMRDAFEPRLLTLFLEVMRQPHHAPEPA